MNLSLTHDQLTLETIATILNSAYIKTEVVKRREGARGASVALGAGGVRQDRTWVHGAAA